MLIKWEDEHGVSYLDYIIHASQLSNENIVRTTQATLDQKLVSREFDHGTLWLLSDKGTIITTYELGPEKVREQPPLEPERPPLEEHEHDHEHEKENVA